MSNNDNNSVDLLFDGIMSRDKGMLAKAITLAESTLESNNRKLEVLLKKILPHTGHSIRIGITGIPGVGKSTFIESFGQLLLEQGKKIGILTIDPSSPISKGSILGDKTRMGVLNQSENVFIRPSPSSLILGGVSMRAREVILLFEAFGFDIIIVETVGVGQSETNVHNMVDFFLLLQISGAGDELQGIKKGIIEMTDGIAVTKADGHNLKNAKLAMSVLEQALHYLPAAPSGWKPRVLTTSALENKGIDKVWEMIQEHHRFVTSTDYFIQNRTRQLKLWFEESLENQFKLMLNETKVKQKREVLIKSVLDGSILPFEAAKILLDSTFKK